MNTAAPAAPQTASTVSRLVPRLGQVGVGKLFRTPADPDRILVLLSHSQVDVRDTSHIWCVVVAAGTSSAAVPGELVPLPRDIEVERLHLVRPMQLAPGN